MIINLTVGVMKGREDLSPIRACYVGSTAHWPMESFHKYIWYRCVVRVPFNMGRPKVLQWRILTHQESKE